MSNRFELLVQSITDYAIYMLDPTGIVSSWNAGAQRFKGYTADEIVGSHFSQFYTDADRDRGLPAIALQTAVDEGRYESEGWRVRKDGSQFWAHVVIDPIRDSAGAILGYAKITRDLTQRRATEEALRRSEERFRLLVQSVTDYAIYMLDLDGKVASWNPGAQRFKGYAAEEIIGQHFSRFYTDEDRAANMPRAALATATSTGKFESEGWRLRKDGSRFWASVVIDTVRDSTGTLVGYAKITRDLTERKQAQEALEQAQEAFFQSQKMDAIGKLTGGVAHDFNNLLAVVLGSLELAQRRLEQGGDITRFLENARTAAERGATLTQRMLAFARRQELKLETVDAVLLVRGMAELLHHTLGAGVSVDTRFPPVLDCVHADAGQLELAILNLAVNARDAMPDGGSIVIAAREEVVRQQVASQLSPGRYICLSVTDEGEGMDSDTLTRAMEPFFTTKDVGKGTGLGLSMVHGFAEQCGGRLLLRSRPGEGTTAELWIPVAGDGAEQAAPLAQAIDGVAACGSLRVLAVDDDLLVLTNTSAMLEDLGHHVVQASCGSDALAVLGEQQVDLLLTDFAMPGMTGLQLAEAAQKLRPDLPVLLVSGYAEPPPEGAKVLLKLGKPFRAQELSRAIEDVLADRRA
ncbi:MAG: PAS domain S-box protein [Sphingobium sp.]|nr:PAS domain S-box protein [Sphingobium sp.]MDX3909679.1 PAS domain S-box protein [Sphingobium sp.]